MNRLSDKKQRSAHEGATWEELNFQKKKTCFSLFSINSQSQFGDWFLHYNFL